MAKHTLEKDIQLVICDYLSLKRYHFWRQNTIGMYDAVKKTFRSMPKYSMNGVPDIILIKDGIFWGLEVKQPKGKQSENQKIFEYKTKKAGGKYNIVTSLDDIIALGL